MIYITQLIYLIDGQESTFDQFESVAIPIIAKYNGQLLIRTRPAASSNIELNMEPPYEIHLIEFATEKDFENFMVDPERKKFVHLKEQSIRAAFLIKGTKL